MYSWRKPFSPPAAVVSPAVTSQGSGAWSQRTYKAPMGSSAVRVKVQPRPMSMAEVSLPSYSARLLPFTPATV